MLLEEHVPEFEEVKPRKAVQAVQADKTGRITVKLTAARGWPFRKPEEGA